MVRPPSARSDPPAHLGRTAQAGAAGHAGATHALAFALATCRSRHAAYRRARHAGNFAAVTRLLGSRKFLGASDSVTAHLRLFAPEPPSALPHPSRSIGTIV